MKPGTKPTPSALKHLQGTFRTDRSAANEPMGSLLKNVPVAPDWLNEWAKAEWQVVTKWLHEVKLLTAADLSLVAAYCQQMGIYREAEERLRKLGSRVIVTEKGYEMPSPWVAIGNKALMLALKIAPEYGITPSARTRIEVPTGEEEDEFEKYMRMN